MYFAPPHRTRAGPTHDTAYTKAVSRGRGAASSARSHQVREWARGSTLRWCDDTAPAAVAKGHAKAVCVSRGRGDGVWRALGGKRGRWGAESRGESDTHCTYRHTTLAASRASHHAASPPASLCARLLPWCATIFLLTNQHRRCRELVEGPLHIHCTWVILPQLPHPHTKGLDPSLLRCLRVAHPLLE